MHINLYKTLNNLLIKNQTSLGISLGDIKEKETINLMLSNKEHDTITLALDKKPLLKLSLEEVLKELNITVTKDNLLILHKLMEKKIILSKKKFQSISNLLNKFPQIKEEILEFLFNPLLKLILLNNHEEEKATLYIKQDKNNDDIEFIILYQHPNTNDILVKIYWGKKPKITMYFAKQNVKDFFASRIHNLHQQLKINCIINFYYKQKVQPETEPSYYKINLKV